VSAPQGYLDQIRRTEVENLALRKRNGELAIALSAVAPDVLEEITKPDAQRQRFNAIDKIVTLAIELTRVDGYDDGSFEAVLDALNVAVHEHEARWQVGTNTTIGGK
jgi:hypothetical protein